MMKGQCGDPIRDERRITECPLEKKQSSFNFFSKMQEELGETDEETLVRQAPRAAAVLQRGRPAKRGQPPAKIAPSSKREKEQRAAPSGAHHASESVAASSSNALPQVRHTRDTFDS